MELMGMGDMDSGCEEENCGLASGFPEDCSDQACLWEEPMFGLIELVCVTVLYIPLMLFGLLGNILTILVVCLRPHMRSSTYLYLSSMAVSDLLILLLLPLDLYKLWRPRPWPLGDLACKLTMFLSECCTFCTILHITFLSVERYLAVCWPITSKTLVTRRRTRALIGCLWLGAAVSAAPVLVMVGVEEVGAEEPGLVSGWSEDGGWTGMEGEQGGFMIGGREIGSGHVTSMDVGLERIKWGQDEKKRWGEGVVEEVERKLRTGEPDESKQGVAGGTKDDAGEGAGEGMMEAEGKQQNKMKEDEGGGREKGVDAGSRGEVDNRECRCTHYAVSSGLLSAMMILSNLYFLVPLCILGLVYSLIGRTLWLRPQSSRRDQSHRHTVKMLGVIVLAFVLCWLPFHVGRTIFSLSQSTGADSQEAYSDSNEMNTVSDSTDGGINTNAVNEPINFKTFSETAKMTTHGHPERDDMFCDKCAKNKVEIKIQSALNSHTSFNTDTSTNTLYNMQDYRTPSTVGTNTYTASPTQLYNDQTNDYTPFNYTYTDPDTNLYFLYYLSQYFNLVSSVLFYLSAAVNPLLYNLMSARYRQAVHSLIHTHSHTQSHRLRSFTIRHSTTTL